MELAKSHNVFPHVVLPDPKIETILIKKPKDLTSLEDILGFQKTSKYGNQILKVILENNFGEFSSQGTPNKSKKEKEKDKEVSNSNSNSSSKGKESKKRKQESPDLRDQEVPSFDTGLVMDTYSGSDLDQDDDMKFLSTIHTPSSQTLSQSKSKVSTGSSKTSSKGIFDSPEPNSDDDLLGYDLDDIVSPTKKTKK